MNTSDVNIALVAWCNSMRKAIELSIQAQEQITKQLKLALSSWETMEGAILTTVRNEAIEQAAKVAKESEAMYGTAIAEEILALKDSKC